MVHFPPIWLVYKINSPVRTKMIKQVTIISVTIFINEGCLSLLHCLIRINDLPLEGFCFHLLTLVRGPFIWCLHPSIGLIKLWKFVEKLLTSACPSCDASSQAPGLLLLHFLRSHPIYCCPHPLGPIVTQSELFQPIHDCFFCPKN